MEDVLEVYQRPHDPEYPLVCLDETSKQLIAERACQSRRNPDDQPGATTSMNGTEPPICS
jgi:hypothetical protein